MRGFVGFIRERGISGFAIGFILGKATSDLIGAFVNDIVNPLIGIVTGNFQDLSKLSVRIGSAEVAYGDLIVQALNFLVLALVVYMLFKVLRLERLDQAPAPKQPAAR